MLLLTGKEKKAVVRVAVMMQGADGRTDSKEIAVNFITFKRLGIDTDELEGAKDMSTLEAFSIIKNMLPHEKEFVTAFLGALIVADQDIDDKELELWRLISTMCELPTMHLKDAAKKYVKLMTE